MIPTTSFDRSRLILCSLQERNHLLDLDRILHLEPRPVMNQAFRRVARNIRRARKVGASVILMAGAHLLRDGLQRYIIDLMEKHLIDCFAVNGAGVIHDFEFALVGGTTESVSEYIRDGRFGFWKETGRINDIVCEAAAKGKGLGESVGKVIHDERFPNRQISVLAAGYRLGIPVTVHVGIGQDIVHQLPNCDGGAYGAASYTDFLRLAKILERVENGVVMNFGSAVMGPEVYLKALSMVRNVAARRGASIARFTTLVCDLVHLPNDYRKEADPTDPAYYFRPWKTMLVRTVAQGGESHYVRGRHKETFPQLWTALTQEDDYDRER
ncbi:MAG: hypothetical protein JRH05_17165 [Deltaproteobacteria bacterium]|nr:hypothetical protein [Deltaproteobacteria bacterium]